MQQELVEILKGITRLEANQESMKEEVSTMRQDIESIKKEDAEQNRLLAEHIAGVKSAHKRIDIEQEIREKIFKEHEEKSQNRYKGLDSRLSSMEIFPNFVKSLGKISKWVTIVAGAAITITKLFGMW